MGATRDGSCFASRAVPQHWTHGPRGADRRPAASHPSGVTARRATLISAFGAKSFPKENTIGRPRAGRRDARSSGEQGESCTSAVRLREEAEGALDQPGTNGPRGSAIGRLAAEMTALAAAGDTEGARVLYAAIGA